MQLLSAKIEETEYHNLFRKPYHRKFGIISTNDCVKPCRLKRSLFHLQLLKNLKKTWSNYQWNSWTRGFIPFPNRFRYEIDWTSLRSFGSKSRVKHKTSVSTWEIQTSGYKYKKTLLSNVIFYWQSLLCGKLLCEEPPIEKVSYPSYVKMYMSLLIAGWKKPYCRNVVTWFTLEAKKTRRNV